MPHLWNVYPIQAAHGGHDAHVKFLKLPTLPSPVKVSSQVLQYVPKLAHRILLDDRNIVLLAGTKCYHVEMLAKLNKQQKMLIDGLSRPFSKQTLPVPEQTNSNSSVPPEPVHTAAMHAQSLGNPHVRCADLINACRHCPCQKSIAIFAADRVWLLTGWQA